MAKFTMPYHYFICPECDENKEMQPKEFIAHLRGTHKIKASKGRRELVLHINMRPRHRSTYKWTIEGKEFYEYYG